MQTNIDRPVLIIDAMNVFVRAYSAYPQMNTNGEQIGGAIGFLKIMQRLINEQQPSAVYIAWEGGGSARRRKLYPEYKLKRAPEKLNRFYGDDIPDNDDNKKSQIVKLLGMLRCAPVCQLYVSDAEGDDLVAYLCTGPLRDKQKVIASSDKDLYQLLNDKTRIYSLHKKIYIKEEDVLEQFRVLAQNFGIAKALCGDTGDNVPGIKGIGFKTVSKLYPFLGSDKDAVLQDVIDYAASHRNSSRFHARVFDEQKDLKRNFKLVFLDGSMLSPTQCSSVDHVMSTYQPKVDKMGMVKLMVKEGVGDFDVERFFYTLNCISGVQYKTSKD